MKNMLLIGVGGIGGFVAKHLNRLVLADQIKLENFDVTVADDDVVERKNIRYQNFTAEDIFKKKADVIGDRYCFRKKVGKIKTENDLKGYDLIIIAVDNSATRKMVFDYCYKNDVYFIDTRAEGRAIAYFTKDCEKEKLLNTLGTNISEEGTSCQLKHDLDNGIIQNGNVIIASICSQLVLNWTREENNPKELIMRV